MKPKNTSKTLDAVVILMLVVLVALVVVIILGYTNNWNWTGLHGKTLFDWLQLLIIPAVLAAGGYLFTYTTSQNEQKATQLRDQTERDIALDYQREAALQAYIDNMSALLLENDLSNIVELDKVLKVGRVRTLTALRRCDGKRKAIVLQFLSESGLINRGVANLDLEGADFSKAELFRAQLSIADLNRANLSEAALIEANLIEAILKEANLLGANLTGAHLLRADLYRADLSYANLTGAKVTTEELDKAKSLQGATMPDGTKHA